MSETMKFVFVTENQRIEYEGDVVFNKENMLYLVNEIFDNQRFDGCSLLVFVCGTYNEVYRLNNESRSSTVLRTMSNINRKLNGNAYEQAFSRFA